MFWPFGKFGKEERFLGVDIGTTSIKIAELAKSGRGAKLVNYALLETYSYLERVNTALQTSGLKLFEQEAANHLKLMLSRGGFRARQAVASLPAFSVFTTVIEIPVMSDEELNKTLQFEARQYIPMPVATVALDWIRTTDKNILLMAIPNEQIERYKKIFSGAGLNLAALEIEGMSLARSLSSDTPSSDTPILIIDIGSRSTGLFIAENGLLKMVGQTDFSGASITRAVSAGLGVNMRRAEDLKKQRGLIDLGFGPDQELSTLMKPVLDVIINEAKRLAQNFATTYSVAPKSVILAGGGVALPGIEDYVGKEMNLTVAKANPFAKIDPPEKAAALLRPLGPSLAVAVGAGLRNINI